ncbi:TniB family NTP-binding protein [Kangiella shandongensis]|uniref:TniB family NTP-binding protein n=1 Tax=Kangiella shandongensis TaxID=2763258 RepID=UPI001CBEE2CF|nr:TniB family NTP-binding protein [Kangiella shandongensis]
MNIEDVKKLGAEERIHHIQSGRWIGYERAKNLIAYFNELLNHPKVSRMPNALLVGDTNNGKTMVLDTFVKQHPAREGDDGESVYAPVLAIEAPAKPDVDEFYCSILEKVFAPYKPNDRVSKKKFQVYGLLEELKVRVLVIDEIHNVVAGSEKNKKQFLNVIKGLGNHLKIPIIAAGTAEAFNAIQSDDQLANRFNPCLLPKWKLDKDYLRLLASFEATLPLRKASKLATKQMATKILSLSEGSIGEISTVLTRAAIDSIQSEEEHITLESLNRISYIPPSERRRMRMDV